MNKELKKDIALLTKYLRRFGVKHPEVYLTGFTHYESSAEDVKCSEQEPKTTKNLTIQGVELTKREKRDLQNSNQTK